MPCNRRFRDSGSWTEEQKEEFLQAFRRYLERGGKDELVGTESASIFPENMVLFGSRMNRKRPCCW